MEFLIGGARPKEDFSLSAPSTPQPTPTKRPARKQREDSSEDEEIGEAKEEEEVDYSSDEVQALNAVSPESLRSQDEDIVEAWELDPMDTSFLDH